MKNKVWEVLIDKEANRANHVGRQLEKIQGQYQHLCDRMSYIEGLVLEYSSSAAGSAMQRSTYQLQLYRMREKLGEEAQLLSVKIGEIKLSLAAHQGEIKKFEKMRVLAEERRQEKEQRAQSRQDDETSTMQFNFQRRGY